MRRFAANEPVSERLRQVLDFRLGDVRDYPAVLSAIRNSDVVIHAAALKQVPACERFPYQAVQTNVIGAEHIVRAVLEQRGRLEAVIGVSSDKACKPLGVMGATKALMERLFAQANMDANGTRFCCVRFGNVLASRGSVLPLFLDQIAAGGPVTVSHPEMTRFLLTMDEAVDAVFECLSHAGPGDTYVPRARAVRIMDLAQALIGGRAIPIACTSPRPGDKIHEELVSEEETARTTERGGYYVIHPVLPEIWNGHSNSPALREAFSSDRVTLDEAAIRSLVSRYLPPSREREGDAPQIGDADGPR
jgi:UDP-glucose 4-epimerase